MKATTNDRSIEVELEAITPNATRMRSVAKHQSSILRDQATGLEIVLQTEKILNNWNNPADRPGPPSRPARRQQPTTGERESLAKTSQTQLSK